MTEEETKAGYVARQTQTRKHTCHWPGCNKQIPPALWGCPAHWFRLPVALRREIWRTYRKGQEIDGRPSPEYLRVAENGARIYLVVLPVQRAERLHR